MSDEKKKSYHAKIKMPSLSPEAQKLYDAQKALENNKTEYVRSPKDVVKHRNAFNKFMTIFMGSKKHSGMYYDNGQPIYGGNSTKDISYYENGQKYSESDIKNGVYHGENIIYYPDGTIKFKASYKNGKLHGKSIENNPDGSLKSTVYNENGKKISYENADFVKDTKNKGIVKAWDKALKKTKLERGEDIELICIKCETKRGNTAIKKCITCGWIFPD